LTQRGKASKFKVEFEVYYSLKFNIHIHDKRCETFTFTSRVSCSSAIYLTSFFNLTKSEINDGDVSQIHFYLIQEFDMASYDLNNICDESLTISQLASTDSIASRDTVWC